MEENQRITYDLRRLAVGPSPPLHKDPICAVVQTGLSFGRIGSGGDNFRIESGTTPDPAYLELLLPSMRLAQRLLVHSFAMPKLAAIVAGTNSPHPLIEPAIRRVLADTRGMTALDPTGGLESVAQHSQVRPKDMSSMYQLQELTIFVNHRHMQRFLNVKSFGQLGEVYYDRHLLYTAIAIAHALVYALKPQVYHMLKDSPEAKISYKPGFTLCTSSCKDPDTQGWDFETHILGGGLDAGWRRDLAAQRGSTVHETEGPRFSFGALQARHTEREGLDMKPFDTITIRKSGPDGDHVVEIDKTWVTEMVEAFVHDQTDKIALPPKMSMTPLDTAKFVTCGRARKGNAPYTPDTPDTPPGEYRPSPLEDYLGNAGGGLFTTYGQAANAPVQVQQGGGALFGYGQGGTTDSTAQTGGRFGSIVLPGLSAAPGGMPAGLSFGVPPSRDRVPPTQAPASLTTQPSPLEAAAASLSAQLTTVALENLQSQVDELKLAMAAKDKAAAVAMPGWITPAVAILIPLVLLLLYRTS